MATTPDPLSPEVDVPSTKVDNLSSKAENSSAAVDNSSPDVDNSLSKVDTASIVASHKASTVVGAPAAPLPAPLPDAQDEDLTVYPGKAKAALIMSSLYISVFLVALDRTILGTAIPRITDQFHSIDDIGW
jgi:hypothetical protein